MLGLFETIEAKTEEEFIGILLREKCVTLRAEIKREEFGCLEFKENGDNKEIFLYSIELSAKNKEGKAAVFVKKFPRNVEAEGEMVYDPSYLLQVIAAEKNIVKEIEEEVSGIEVWIVVPKKRYFNNGGYEKIKKAINE